MDACEKLLSIIIPSYNMEEYLPKCIGSLMVKDKDLFNALDVIVVNDGSQDRTSDIAHEWAGKYPDVIKVIDKDNGHYGSCVNEGLRRARGRYVKILDSDDWFDIEGFSEFLQVLVSLPKDVDLVLNDYERFYVLTGTKVREGLGLKAGRYSFEEVIKSNSQFGMANITYKTQVLQDVNYRQTEGMMYTDVDWNTLPMKNVNIVQVTDKVVYQYRIGREGQSVSVQAKNIGMMKALMVRSRDWFVHSTNYSTPYIEYVRRVFLAACSSVINLLMFDCPYPIVNAGLADVDSVIKSAGVDADKAFDRLCLLSHSSHPYRYFRVWQKQKKMSHIKLIAIRKFAALIRIANRFSAVLSAKLLHYG